MLLLTQVDSSRAYVWRANQGRLFGALTLEQKDRPYEKRRSVRCVEKRSPRNKSMDRSPRGDGRNNNSDISVSRHIENGDTRIRVHVDRREGTRRQTSSAGN